MSAELRRAVDAARVATSALTAPLQLKIAVALAASFVLLLLFMGIVVSATQGEQAQQRCEVLADGGDSALLPEYVPFYEEAASKYRLGARGFGILAAIHKVETDFGRLDLPGVTSGENFAGAGGPMQFLQPTWDAYGVDADGDGARDRYEPEDAIHGAANYLKASGAPGDWYAAVFAYNHADWYVQDVFGYAERFGGAEVECTAIRPGGGSGVSLGAIDWNDTSGSWAGSKKFADLALKLARRNGCDATSAKRETVSTASGGVSDHWVGNKTAYAYDFGDSTCSTEALDDLAADIAANFKLSASTGLVTAYNGRYRIQLIWQAADHYDHVHIGVARI